MNPNVQYSFCPYCGALMNQGQCLSCGYVMSVQPVQQPIQPEQFVQSVQYEQPVINPNKNMDSYTMPQFQQPAKKTNTGLVVGIIIGCVLFLFAVICVVVFGVFQMLKYNKTQDLLKNQADIEEFDHQYDEDGYDYSYKYDDEDEVWDEDSDGYYNWDDYLDGKYGEDLSVDEFLKYYLEQQGIDMSDESTEKDEDDDELIDIDGDGVGELEYESGLEGLNADYYPIITDYIRHDLSYSVHFSEYYDADGRLECYYPVVSGDNIMFSYLNDAFYTVAKEAEEITDMYECQANSVAYVTYMDEDLLSVVFIDVYSFDDGTNYEDILCYNIDMKNWDVLDFQLKDTSDVFIEDLEERCLEQSTSDADYLFGEYTYDEIREMLASEEYMVAFYTPLGMEIGISYDGYWCCSTYKDYENYLEIVTDGNEF